MTVSGFNQVLWSGAPENTKLSSASSMPRLEAVRAACWRYAWRSARVCGSATIRRRWWVFVSFSHVTVLTWATVVRMSMTLVEKSMRSQRRAHSSPRRAPVVMASQANMPQSGSFHADPTIWAACVGDGGCESGGGCGGASAWRTGFVPIQRQRTARVKAPFSTVWI